MMKVGVDGTDGGSATQRTGCMCLLSELGRDDRAIFRGVYGFNPPEMLRRKKLAV